MFRILHGEGRPVYLLLEDGSWVALIALDEVDEVVHVCASTETMSLVD